MLRNALAVLAIATIAVVALVLAWPDADGDRPAAGEPVAVGPNAVGPNATPPAPASAEIPTSEAPPGDGRATAASRREVDTPAPIAVDPESSGHLAIMVRDAAGDPAAHVPLRLAVLGNGYWRTAWSSVSAADGSAEVDDIRRRTVAFQPDATATEVLVIADAPLGTRPRVAVDLAALPERPIELILPPTGSVVVIVDSANTSRLEVEQAFLAEVGLLDAEAAVARRAEAEIEDGRATFPLVGLGLRLRAAVQIAGANEEREVEFDGPTAPTQEVVVRVPLVDETPVLIARLVDADGRPLAVQELRVTAQARIGRSRTTSMMSIQSDAEGHVFFTPSDDLGPAATRSLQFRSTARGLYVETEVPRPLKPGENDLGTLRMFAPPLLMAGRVVDADGAAIAGAEVDLRVEIVLDESNPDARYWDRVDGGEARTDDEGQFEIHGVANGTALDAQVKAEGYVDAPTGSVHKGIHGVVITLERAGGITGEILLPKLGAPAHLRVHATHRATGAVASDRPRDGEFELASIEPGRVDVGVTLFGRIEPIAAVRDVLVKSGRTTRLDPIDLTSVLRRLTFRVVDPSGAMIRNAHALWMPSDSWGGRRDEVGGIRTRDGHGEIIAPTEPIDLLVYADGHRSQRVVAVRDGQDVVLSPSPKLRLQVPADALPTPPFELRARVEAGDGAFQADAHYVLRGPTDINSMSGMLPWHARLKATVDATGAARFDLPDSGTWRVRWTLAKAGSEGGASTAMEDLEPREVVVRDVGGEQVFDVVIPEGQLERAMAEIR